MLPVYIENPAVRRTYREIVPNPDNHAFVDRIFRDRFIRDYRHSHAEVELIYVHKGVGTKNIGDLSLPCPTGDVSLIGSEVPHYYTLDSSEGEEVEVWVIQFEPDFPGERFLSYSEALHIRTLLRTASPGVSFGETVSRRAADIWGELSNARDYMRICLFFRLLGVLSVPGSYASLPCTEQPTVAAMPNDRLQAVQHFLLGNFTEHIALAQVAQMVHLSRPAFCNLFKKRFNQCFSEYLQHLRLSHAARLLAETDLPVSDVWYQSGFRNQSYFNRCFSRHYGLSPLRYRNYLAGALKSMSPGQLG